MSVTSMIQIMIADQETIMSMFALQGEPHKTQALLDHAIGEIRALQIHTTNNEEGVEIPLPPLTGAELAAVFEAHAHDHAWLERVAREKAADPSGRQLTDAELQGMADMYATGVLYVETRVSAGTKL